MSNEVARRGLCLVIAAPSGAGKSSIARALSDGDPAITLSVSATTRAPRAGEQDGMHYHFVSDARFAEMAAGGELLEHATVFGRSYGTPRAPVERALGAGRDVLFDIDWQGHLQLRASLPGDVVGLFVLPPSIAALESRLRRRGDGEAQLARRMAEARGELSHWADFDYAIVNDDLARAIADTRAILCAERLRRVRRTGLADFVAAL